MSGIKVWDIERGVLLQLDGNEVIIAWKGFELMGEGKIKKLYGEEKRFLVDKGVKRHLEKTRGPYWIMD